MDVMGAVMEAKVGAHLPNCPCVGPDMGFHAAHKPGMCGYCICLVCFVCKKLINQDDAVWLLPDGTASTGDGSSPYHVECAPEQPDYE